jgi:hypothetical protein
MSSRWDIAAKVVAAQKTSEAIAIEKEVRYAELKPK